MLRQGAPPRVDHQALWTQPNVHFVGGLLFSLPNLLCHAAPVEAHLSHAFVGPGNGHFPTIRLWFDPGVLWSVRGRPLDSSMRPRARLMVTSFVPSVLGRARFTRLALAARSGPDHDSCVRAECSRARSDHGMEVVELRRAVAELTKVSATLCAPRLLEIAVSLRLQSILFHMSWLSERPSFATACWGLFVESFVS